MKDAYMFIKFDDKESGHVTHRDNTRGEILGKGVVVNPSLITIGGMILVKRIKHNLLSVIQLCDKGYFVAFSTLSFLIEHKARRDLMFKGYRIDKIYICLIWMICRRVELNA